MWNMNRVNGINGLGGKERKAARMLAAMALLFAVFAGCGSQGAESGTSGTERAASGGNPSEENTETRQPQTGLLYETAEDGHIDFEALKAENSDIFAWLYVPGTDIDYPVLQSPVSDDFYKTHTADGKEGAAGALYTEMPNMMNLCDFNTIIHGRDDEEGSLFEDLHLFENPDFFTEHEKFYLYLPDNVLTYEIFAAYYDEGSDILRRYDYTTYEGCDSYLKQMYGLREMGKNQREGWDDLTPYHFLVTLDGCTADDRQYVVCGALTGDAAGNINRVILDWEE
jgi:Uncharacterized protein conserved in bacteria